MEPHWRQREIICPLNRFPMNSNMERFACKNILKTKLFACKPFHMSPMLMSTWGSISRTSLSKSASVKQRGKRENQEINCKIAWYFTISYNLFADKKQPTLSIKLSTADSRENTHTHRCTKCTEWFTINKEEKPNCLRSWWRPISKQARQYYNLFLWLRQTSIVCLPNTISYGRLFDQPLSLDGIEQVYTTVQKWESSITHRVSTHFDSLISWTN